MNASSLAANASSGENIKVVSEEKEKEAMEQEEYDSEVEDLF